MTLAWSLLLSGCVYVGAHLGVYLLMLRHLSAFRNERVIFAYHAVSFAALLAGVTATSVATGVTDVIQAALAAVSIHAIYSMSFLEAWSLSQISYSIAILNAIDAKPGLDTAAAARIFADTGDAKKASRLSSLQALGLIALRDERPVLSPPGRVVARVLAGLRWIANLEQTG